MFRLLEVLTGRIYTREAWTDAQGGKNEGLCEFFFKILKYKFLMLKNQKL